MKKLLYFLIPLLIFSCKKDGTMYGNELGKSNNSWNSYKESVNNSYSYIAYSQSVFGSYAETKIIVQSGKVTGRVYKAGVYAQNSTTLQIRDSWVEDSTNLNTHENGDLSLTLDDIYAKAPKEWLSVDKKKNDIYFTADANGIIESCGYVPKGCQDDCFHGIRIKSIKPL